MDINLIVTLILCLLALALLVGGPIVVLRRAARLNDAQEAQAVAFEREMLATAHRADRQPAETTSPVPRAEPRQRLGREYPVFGVVMPPPGAPVEAAPAAQPPAPGSETSPLVRSIIDKLSVAGVFKSVEGPLRCANPDIRGTLISLKGGKRLGILDSAFDRADPALDGLMRHLDGLIVSGPDGQALYLKRFQDFLSDLMML